MPKINPFQPNSPVSSGMFVGRLNQLEALETALLQTRAGQPKSFMITGERGIGKTSLLQYFKFVARGDLELENEKMNFLVIEIDLDNSTTDIGLIMRVQMALDRELGKSEQARTILSSCWEFVKNIEAFGVKLRDSEQPINPETIHDQFAYSLADTTNRITQSDANSIFGNRYDGVVLLIDEADNAPATLALGAFLKLLTERLQRHGCNKFMIGLAGLPPLRDNLRASHASCLRIFEELQLGTLSDEETGAVLDYGLKDSNEKNIEQTTIDDEGRAALIYFSEGYPHFIQQFAYSAFAADTDGIITHEDVWKSALGIGGALERIGDQYYRGNFYNKIQKESYRQVLRIMAEHSDKWVSKKQIKASFKGKTSTLDNAILALRDRNIIISKEGVRGTYRLQHRGFALWIKLYTSNPKDLQTQIRASDYFINT